MLEKKTMTRNTNLHIEQQGDFNVNLISFQRYLRASNYSPRTQDTYSQAVIQFADFIVQKGMPLSLGDLRREHVEHWINMLLETRSASTANNRYRGLQAFWKFLMEEGEISRNPMANMRPPKVAEQIVPVLSESDLKNLLGTCTGNTFESRRDMAILRMFITTGARRAEIAGLRYDPDEPESNDLDFDMAVARVIGKGGRDRLLPLDPRTGAGGLDRYLRVRAKHSRVFLPDLWLGKGGKFTADGIRQMIERRGNQAGLGHIHAHQMRHTFAHAWLADGGTEGDLMRSAGWKSRTMLQRYASSTAQERALAASRKIGLGNRI